MKDLKLNIGCGRDYRDGWVNIDISKHVKADMHQDIRTENLGQPDGTIPDGGASLIWISGVLEQIGSNDEFLHVMRECYRVLKEGGLMQAVVPNAKFAIGHRDPMDIRKFTPDTFQYFLKGTQEFRDYGSVYGFDGWSEIIINENARHILTITFKK